MHEVNGLSMQTFQEKGVDMQQQTTLGLEIRNIQSVRVTEPWHSLPFQWNPERQSLFLRNVIVKGWTRAGRRKRPRLGLGRRTKRAQDLSSAKYIDPGGHIQRNDPMVLTQS